MSNETFIQKYFIEPITSKTGYNPVNTVTYGALLVLGAYALFKFLKWLGYKVDLRLLKASTPFILLVSVWHALTDAGVYPYGFLTTTPGLYIPVLALFFPLIIVAKKLEDKFGWRYEWVYSGISLGLLAWQLIIYAFLAASLIKPDAVLRVLLFTALTATPFLILSRFVKLFKDPFNLLMFVTHMFDASVTHVSVTYYGYFEQHVAPNLVFNLFNSSLSFFAWKILILFFVIFLLNWDKKDVELNKFIKIVFIVYGLATGVRGLLRLSLGV